MNYHIYFSIIIFILLITCFYLVINNFGISTISINKTNSISDIVSLEKNLSLIQNELAAIKSEVKLGVEPEIIISTNSNGLDPNNQNNPNNESNLNSPCMSGSCNLGNLGNSGPKPPPIIFDPIARYDQAKLLDPLVDPRGRTSADQIPAPQIAAQFNFPTQGVLDRYHRVGLLIALDGPDSADISPRHKPKRERKHARKHIYSDDNSSSLSNSSNSTNSTNSTNLSGIPGLSGSYKGVEIASIGPEKIESFGIVSDEGPNGILELIGKKITDNWYKYFTSISKGNKIIKIVVHNKNRKELYTGDVVYIPELNRWYQVQIDEMDMIEYNPYFF